MGFMGNLFGGGSSDASKKWAKRALWSPSSVNIGGFSGTYTPGKGKQNVGSSYNWGLDEANQGLRDQYYGVANAGLERMLSYDPNGGVDLGEEFGISNQTGLPDQFYDPENFRALTSGAGALGQSALADAQGLIEGGSQGAYDKYLQLLRSSAQDYENNFLQGGMDKQFLQGILGSTAGSYQTQGMMDSIENADIQRQLEAYGVSQDALDRAFSRAGQATGMFQGLEGDAANRGFMINELQGNRANERFMRAMNMFGANQSQLGDALQMLGAGNMGISGQDQMLANLLGLQGNLAAQRSGANANAAGIVSSAAQADQAAWTSIINQAQASAAQVASSWSDRRLKTDIKQIGTTPGGYPWYSFTYIWGEPSQGVMADEVPAEWVSYDGNGFALVDYSKVQ